MSDFSVETVYLYEYDTIGILHQAGLARSLIEFQKDGFMQRIWIDNEQFIVTGEIDIGYSEV